MKHILVFFLFFSVAKADFNGGSFDVLNDVSPTAISEGDSTQGRQTPQRAKHINLRDQSGIELGTKSNPIQTSVNQSGNDFVFSFVATSSINQVKVNRTSYTEPAAQGAFSIRSSSGNDTSAGTGARTVQVNFFNSALTTSNIETVTLNGTSCVNSSTTSARFFEKLIVKTAGSGESNVGTLTLFTGTGCSTVVGTIAANDIQTFWGHHYVLASKTARFTGLSASHNGTTVGSGGVFVIKSLAIGVSNAIEFQVSDFLRLYGQSSTTSRNYNSAIKIDGPARIQIYVRPETGTASEYRAAVDYFEE